jgi:hypothetical protein
LPRATEDKKSATRSREAVLQNSRADITASLFLSPKIKASTNPRDFG